MRVLLFGTGQYYNDYRPLLHEGNGFLIVGLLDNNPAKRGKMLDGKVIYSLDSVSDWPEYDKILLLSARQNEMNSQLIRAGISEYKICRCSRIGELFGRCDERDELLEVARCWSRKKNRVLLVQHEMGGGGAAAAAAAAAAICKYMSGFSLLVTSAKDGSYKDLYEKLGVPFICNPRMNCDTPEFMNIVDSADYIFVNTIVTYNVVGLVQNAKAKVYWWLHDHDESYINYCEIDRIKSFNYYKVKLLAVSEKAGEVFCRIVRRIKYDVLTLGIAEDEIKVEGKQYRENMTMTLAQIGDIGKVKGQDVLLTALQSCTIPWRLLLIGGQGGSDCEEKKTALKIAATDKRVVMVGKIPNEEIRRMYRAGEIDAVVVPSRFETMSIAAIEAMSYGVLVVVSDMTGIAEFITDGVDGLIFQSANPEDLREKIIRLSEDQCLRKYIGCNGELLYRKHFTLKSLAARLKSLFVQC